MPKSVNKPTGSIVYVNFSPYENAGHILDYLRSQFKSIYFFAFNFHNLGNKTSTSLLTIYRFGRKKTRHRLFTISATPSLVFILVPLRSVLIALQICFHILIINIREEKPDFYFTVNAFTAWIGNMLRSFRLVQKTVFWVWDYYPPYHPSLITRTMRILYWQFDKLAQRSDNVVFLNNRLAKLRKDIDILGSATPKVVPIGTLVKHGVNKEPDYQLRLCFLGVLKKSQGLDMIFDAGEKLIKRHPMINLEIIGAGPDEQYFRARASGISLPVVFHGYMPDDQDVRNLLKTCHIGIATYVPDPSNVSYYGDPSKIKYYLSFGLPVITTDVFEFSEEIVRMNAGIIVPYGDTRKLLDALEAILDSYNTYSDAAKRLAGKYSYRRLYRSLFVRY